MSKPVIAVRPSESQLAKIDAAISADRRSRSAVLLQLVDEFLPPTIKARLQGGRLRTGKRGE